MKCKHVQKHLLDYSESLLDQNTRSCIEEHIRVCPTCAGELREFEQTVQLLQSVPLQEPPENFWEDFTSDVMKKIHKIGPLRTNSRTLFLPHPKWAIGAVAALLIILGGFALYSTGTLHVLFSPTSALLPGELAVQQAPKQSLESTLKKIAPDELVDDMLEPEFALIHGESMATVEFDNSDETMYFLIESLSDKEKDLLLLELYKMK